MRQRNVKHRLLEHFFQNPTGRYRVRQLERELGLALPSVIRYTGELVDEGFLGKDIIGDTTFFIAGRTSTSYLLEKLLYNLRSLHGSGLIEHLRRMYDNPTLVVFGSYARGEDIETSDIDIYVETAHKKVGDLAPFEERLGRRIQSFVHTSIRSVENERLANNIVNGITLNGFVEVL